MLSGSIGVPFTQIREHERVCVLVLLRGKVRPQREHEWLEAAARCACRETALRRLDASFHDSPYSTLRCGFATVEL